MLTATINTALSFKFQRKKKLGLLSELKYSVKYLHVFLEFGTRGVLSSKVSCPIADLACTEVSVFPTSEGCIESKWSIGQGGVRNRNVIHRFLNQECQEK